MKLPNSDKVIISKKKLQDYILSETHATGKFKAKFFRKLGFNEENIDFFEQVLLNLAEIYDVKDELKSPYGTKYVIEGEIDTPSGKVTKVVTVWIIEENQQIPRFITVYPL